ncbi:hypothetical protein [Novacetimonas hansenii]|uniref:Uncharacterized protein n=1 Tax=Novacetimonas hansenii TaxID=436 RepID=A0AAW5ET35_NOVHA|nr:hypothetical protein [Novacetimonas hansenii]MCJ8353470.1 hypothetical protein [Novacetimonas hansenii]
MRGAGAGASYHHDACVRMTCVTPPYNTDACGTCRPRTGLCRERAHMIDNVLGQPFWSRRWYMTPEGDVRVGRYLL